MKKIGILFVFWSCFFLSKAQYLTEGFEGGTFPPTNWSQEYVSGTVDWTTANGNNNALANANSGSSNAIFYFDDYNGDATKLITPSLDLSADATAQLSFWYSQEDWSGDQDELSVYYKTSAAGSWVLLQSFTASLDVWTEVVLTLPNTSADYYVAFEGLSGYGYGVTLDDIEISAPPACPFPSNLVVNNITSTSADISWTTGGAANWQVAVVASGNAPGIGTATNSNPYSASGLSAATGYDVYVKDSCGVGDVSDWIGPVTFNTTCDVFNIPFKETFNSSSASQQCWTINNNNADADLWNMDYASNPYEGDQVAMMYTDFNAGANDDYLISPPIVLTGNEQLRFYSRVQSSTEPNDFKVMLSTTTADVSSFTNIIMPLTELSNTTYQEYVIDISSYSGTCYIAFVVPTESTLDGWRLYIDDVNVESIPLCPKPTGVAVSNISSTGATLSWATGGAANWQVSVVPSGNVPGIGVGTNSNPYNASGLSASTAYDIYVKDSCGIGDVSDWVGPLTFNTQCDVFGIPFQETFNSSSSTQQCWSVVNNNADADTWNMDYATNPYEGNEVAVINTDFNAGNDDDYLITPKITLTGNEQLRFYTRVQSSGEPNELKVLLSTTNANVSSFTNVIMPLTELSNTTYEEYIYNLSAYSGDVYIAFALPAEATLDGWRLYIDDVNIESLPSCPKPTNILVNNITQSGADISWTSGGASNWDVVVVPSGNAINNPTSVTVTNYTVSGLLEGTAYDVYVRDSCEVGVSSVWSNVTTFSTYVLGQNCDLPIDISAMPYSHIGQNTSSYFDDYSTSPCSNNYISGDEVVYTYTPNNNTAINIDITNITDTWAGLMVTDDCPDVAVNCIGYTTNSSSTGDLNLEVNLIAGTTYYIVISTYATPQSTGYDLNISEISCPSPYDVVVSNITSSIAQIDWTTGGSVIWKVAIVPSGNAISNAQTTTSNPYNVTGLTPETTYDVYVKDSCGVGDVSEWFGPVSFTTPCATITPDYIEDFTSFLPSCWEEAGSGTIASGPSGLGSGDWAADGFMNNGTTGAARINIYSNVDKEWLMSPMFNLSTGVFQLEFDLGIVDYGATTIAQMGSDDRLSLLVTTNNGVTWQELDFWDNSYVTPNGGETFTYDLSAFTGNTKFAFFATDGSIDDAEDVDISIDNFKIIDLSTCPAPTNVVVSNITNDAVDISWTSGGALNWNIIIVETGLQPNGEIALTSTGYSASSLSPNTTYDIYVQDSCGVSDVSLWAGPVSFTTLATCPDVSNIFVTNITETTASVSWTAGGNGTAWNIAIVPSGTSISNVESISQASYAATGLSGSMNYDVYVQEDCGGGDVSNWVGPYTFNTPCIEIVPAYLQSFNEFIPYCWYEANGGSQSTGYTVFGTSNWTGGGYANFGSSGGAKVNLSGSGNHSWLISPEFDFSSGLPYQLDFDLAFMKANSSTVGSGLGSDDFVKILITTNGGSTWFLIEEWDANSSIQIGGEHFSFDLTPYSSTPVVQFAILASDGVVDDAENIDVSIDNFKIDEMQSCPQPQNIVVSQITSSSAKVYWTTGGATNWNIQIVPAGNTPSITGVAITNNPQQFTALAPNTFYDVYVQDDCGMGDLSDWTGPVSFGTTCGAGAVDGDSSSDPIQVSVNSYTNMKNTANCYTNTFATNASADVWYLLILNDCAQSIDVSLCNSGFDTEVHVLDMNQNVIYSDDNGCGGTQSMIDNLAVSGGDSLYIVVEGNGVAEGTYEIEITQNLYSAIPDAGTNGSKNVCKTDPDVYLFDYLGGTPQTSGIWIDLDNTGALSNGVFDATIAGVGTYTFRYNVSSAQCNYVATSLVTINVQNCVGINERTSNMFKLYPNPGADKVIVEVNEIDFGSIIIISTIDGKQLETIKVNNKLTDIDVSSYSRGVYLVQINGFVNKLMIER